MTTCDVPATEPIRAAQACADLVASLPLDRARARRGVVALWHALVERWRARRMPRPGVRRDARPDPADARAAVSHYLAVHWVNR